MCWSICYLSDFDLKRNKKLQLHITTSYKLHIEKKITNTMRDELLYKNIQNLASNLISFTGAR